MNAMKKIALIFITLVLLVGGSVYFYFFDNEYIIRINETQIREKLQSKLPLTKRYFLIVELTLDNPRVSLKNGSSRVYAGLDAILNIKINQHPEPLGGTIDISSGVRYITETGEFFLADLKIESLQIQGIPEKFQSKVNQAISVALTEYLQKNPIYTLKRTDLKKATVRAVLKRVSVENRELVIVLGI